MMILQNAINGAIATFESLRTLEEPLSRASQLVATALCNGRKLLCCGNGGSAADAAHFATEFLCRFVEDRRPYPALALTSEGSLMTAVGNDYCFDEVFSRQVRGLAQAGDILVAFTTSGNSPNILRALEEAKRCNIASIAFLGRDGGKARGLATVELIVPGKVTARIQEGQKLLLHALCEIVEQQLPKA